VIDKNKNLIVKTGSAVLNETINGKKQINNGRIIELIFLTIKYLNIYSIKYSFSTLPSS
tara:strand:- start:1069 stop:1245 length:177 start_codon:yes stop_codon:yes gene_type:complete